jgi:PTH1 family peptidyl-tRNA hydrolase
VNLSTITTLLRKEPIVDSIGESATFAQPWLVVGLGNPGADYADTRHNVGFRVVDIFAARHGVSVTSKKYKSLVGTGCAFDYPVVILKPQQWMNNSGIAVRSAMTFRKIPPERVLVILDDLDMPLARVRVRSDGGSGGHGGLKSIIAEIGTQGFGRVRVGIGRPDRGDVIDFVLSTIHKSEREAIADACERAADAIEFVLTKGYAYAMNAVNG